MMMKQIQKISTPITAYNTEPNTTSGFNHSMVISLKIPLPYLCPPPDEKPP